MENELTFDKLKEIYKLLEVEKTESVTSVSMNKINIDRIKLRSEPQIQIINFGIDRWFGIELIEANFLQDNQFMYETRSEIVLHTIGVGEYRIPKNILRFKLEYLAQDLQN